MSWEIWGQNSNRRNSGVVYFRQSRGLMLPIAFSRASHTYAVLSLDLHSQLQVTNKTGNYVYTSVVLPWLVHQMSGVVHKTSACGASKKCSAYLDSVGTEDVYGRTEPVRISSWQYPVESTPNSGVCTSVLWFTGVSTYRTISSHNCRSEARKW